MASHVSLRKSVAALMAVLLVVVCAGCGKTDGNTIIIPKSYYDYFGDTPGDDLASIKDKQPQACIRAYRKNGGLAIVASREQRENMITNIDSYINYYAGMITSASPQYSVSHSKDYRRLECTLDYKMDSTTRNEAMWGIVYDTATRQLITGAGDNWKLHIVIRDANSRKVVYRVNIPETKIDFNDTTWNL